MKTKCDIISGFLGAGKTTFIKKLLEEIFPMETVVVLENEFGKINLDGDNLRQEGLRVESIIAGCICCTSANDLGNSLMTIIDKYKPERILIEPTGIAKLSDIKGLFREEELAKRCEIDHIITIVDAKNYYNRVRISKAFFENQIQWSQVVLLSKTEDMLEAEIDQVAEAISRVQPTCKIIKKPWPSMTGEEVKEAIAYTPSSPNLKRGMRGIHYGNKEFESLSYEGKKSIKEEYIEDFMTKVQEGHYGEVHRVKGLFQDDQEVWHRLEYVPHQVSLMKVKAPSPELESKCQITIIGCDLKNKDSLFTNFGDTV